MAFQSLWGGFDPPAASAACSASGLVGLILGVASWGCLVMRLPRSFTDATDITMHLRESIFRWHKLGEADAGGDGPVHLASSVSSLASTPRGSRQEVPDHHPHTSLGCRSDWSVFTKRNSESNGQQPQANHCQQMQDAMGNLAGTMQMRPACESQRGSFRYEACPRQ